MRVRCESLAHWLHLLTTSRSYRLLEKRVAELEADNERLRRDNQGLCEALYPQRRAIRMESEVRAKDMARPARTFKPFNSF